MNNDLDKIIDEEIDEQLEGYVFTDDDDCSIESLRLEVRDKFEGDIRNTVEGIVDGEIQMLIDHDKLRSEDDEE